MFLYICSLQTKCWILRLRAKNHPHMASAINVNKLCGPTMLRPRVQDAWHGVAVGFFHLMPKRDDCEIWLLHDAFQSFYVDLGQYFQHANLPEYALQIHQNAEADPKNCGKLQKQYV